MTTPKAISQILTSLFRLASYGETEATDALEMASEAAEIPDEMISPVVDAKTFHEAGVLTMDDGFVVKFEDGTEYQVTIVQSR